MLTVGASVSWFNLARYWSITFTFLRVFKGETSAGKHLEIFHAEQLYISISVGHFMQY
jgi:hypothetical protein